MQEPEVSLRIAMKYIENNSTDNNVEVSLDGAHIKTKSTFHFDVVGFMCKNGYEKPSKDYERWQGEYVSADHKQHIIISSKPGVGDVVIKLKDGRTLFVESKKIKGGSGGEYPAMREAIGQLMTGCPDGENVVPVVAVPHTAKGEELAEKWSCNERIRNAGIRFMLVRENGAIVMV